MMKACITQVHKEQAHREQRSLLKLLFGYYGVKTLPVFIGNIFKRLKIFEYNIKKY